MNCAGNELARCRESEHLLAEVRGLQAEPERQKAAWAVYQSHLLACPICRPSIDLIMSYGRPVSAETPAVAEAVVTS
jgi:hypothetical protein